MIGKKYRMILIEKVDKLENYEKLEMLQNYIKLIPFFTDIFWQSEKDVKLIKRRSMYCDDIKVW